MLKNDVIIFKAWNFNVDLCRSLTLEKDGEGDVRGIKTDRSNAELFRYEILKKLVYSDFIC